jgi:GNAT superfamily N-acetyltransferase
LVEVRRGDILIDIRRLRPFEFGTLKDVNDGFIPDASRSIVLVAQSAGGIVGRIFMVAPSHAEGIWIDERYRGGTLFKEMMEALEHEAKLEGITKMFAYAVHSGIEHYIVRRCGYEKLPWTVLMKELV